MRTTRLASTALALAATLAVASPASAEEAQASHAELPASAKIVNAPPKLLSMKAAAKLRATKRFPRPPRLKVDRSELERSHEPAVAPTPASPAPRLAPAERMFGNESAYAYKRDPILKAIQTYNMLNVPRNGGTYVAPRLYEVSNGGSLPGCTTAVYNGVYCGGAVNSIGWSMTWTAEAFRVSGDMRWATLIAHEYGHAAQGFLRISGGWMNYTLYREALADCMAGGFLYYAHANRLTDSVGRGDYNEFRDAFVALAAPTTQLNNHGTFAWRYALATYGWNTGFDGCTRWARSIDGV